MRASDTVARLGGDEFAVLLPGATIADAEALTLRVPSDGSVAALRALLDGLDRDSIEVEELTVHTPDLDDVFFALTGRTDQELESV